MLELNVETQSLERVLPVVRDIAIRSLASEGFVLRDPTSLVYRPRIEERPERLYIELSQPVVAVICGAWKDATTLAFTIIDLQCSLEGGQWPFVAQSSTSSQPSATSSRVALYSLLTGTARPLPHQQPQNPPPYPPHPPRATILPDARADRSILFD